MGPSRAGMRIIRVYRIRCVFVCMCGCANWNEARAIQPTLPSSSGSIRSRTCMDSDSDEHSGLAELARSVNGKRGRYGNAWGTLYTGAGGTSYERCAKWNIKTNIPKSNYTWSPQLGFNESNIWRVRAMRSCEALPPPAVVFLLLLVDSFFRKLSAQLSSRRSSSVTHSAITFRSWMMYGARSIEFQWCSPTESKIVSTFEMFSPNVISRFGPAFRATCGQWPTIAKGGIQILFMTHYAQSIYVSLILRSAILSLCGLQLNVSKWPHRNLILFRLRSINDNRPMPQELNANKICNNTKANIFAIKENGNCVAASKDFPRSRSSNHDLSLPSLAHPLIQLRHSAPNATPYFSWYIYWFINLKLINFVACFHFVEQQILQFRIRLCVGGWRMDEGCCAGLHHHTLPIQRWNNRVWNTNR